jgi:hypothetical protein
MRTPREKTIEDRFAELDRLLRELRDEVARAPRPPATSVAVAVEQWVRGFAWDATFSDEMAVEEFGRISRRVNEELDEVEHERLLQLWRSERMRRRDEDLEAA